MMQASVLTPIPRRFFSRYASHNVHDAWTVYIRSSSIVLSAACLQHGPQQYLAYYELLLRRPKYHSSIDIEGWLDGASQVPSYSSTAILVEAEGISQHLREQSGSIDERLLRSLLF